MAGIFDYQGNLDLFYFASKAHFYLRWTRSVKLYPKNHSLKPKKCKYSFIESSVWKTDYEQLECSASLSQVALHPSPYDSWDRLQPTFLDSHFYWKTEHINDFTAIFKLCKVEQIGPFEEPVLKPSL